MLGKAAVTFRVSQEYWDKRTDETESLLMFHARTGLEKFGQIMSGIDLDTLSEPPQDYAEYGIGVPAMVLLRYTAMIRETTTNGA
jgi:hypothetical protein